MLKKKRDSLHKYLYLIFTQNDKKMKLIKHIINYCVAAMLLAGKGVSHVY
jgi:hypothetical protein